MFTEHSLIGEIEMEGFGQVNVYDTPYMKYGVFQEQLGSYTLAIRRY